MTLAPGFRLGHYEILAPLGAGGMGEVYRARDTSLDREVAVKVLPERVAASPDALARFEREAKAVAALSHPNILAIHELGRQEGTAYAVTELLEGETLRQRLASGALPQRKAVEQAIQVASGLAAAHAKGIVHRDLKPENLFVTRDGRVKILDFGLATWEPAVDEKATSSPTIGRLTDPGTILGTVGYMSPEQVRGAPVDARGDIFALGAVLYEMLTGRRAFQRDTATETMTAILREDVADLQASGLQVPPGLERLVRRCLEKSADERLQSARDLAIALEAVSGSGVSPAPLPPPSRRPSRLAAAVAALTLVAAALGFVVGRRSAAPSGSGPSRLPRYEALTSRRGVIDLARFGADGNTVVYSASWDSGPWSLFATRLDARRADVAPLAEASLLALSKSGELAVATRRWADHLVVHGTLAQLPIGGGTPRELAENVTAADWSPDGRPAIVRTLGGRTRLEFPIGTVLYETAGWLSSPRFSPAGDVVAFHEHPLHGDDRGWPALVEVGTKAKRNLTSEIDSLTGLAWRPGGREICFANSGSVGCVAREGGEARWVLRGHARFALFDIADDGRLLLQTYVVRGALQASAGGREVDLTWLQYSIPMDVEQPGGRVLFETLDYGIYLRGLDGRPAVRLGEGIPTGLSPDARHVLTIVPGVPTQLSLIPTGPGETRALPGGRLVQHTWAVFAPDGRHVVVSGNEAGKGSRLYLLDLEGGEPRPITDEGVRLAPYVARAVSPDGRHVAAVGPDLRPALYPLAGGAPRPIPGLGDDLVPLGWTDRSDVLFARPRGIGRLCPVYRVDLRDGRRQLWRELGPSDPAGSPAVTIATLTPDGRLHAYAYVRLESELFVVSDVFPAP
jgi:serine/threonine protein kinase